ncbi:MAG: hypothetical protein ACYCX7_06020 [Solirubrobacteraceae bacterium]
MSGAPWRVELTRTAQRDPRRLDPPVRKRETALRTLVTRVLPRGRAYRD